MTWSKRYEGAEPQRVNKWLAQQGVCSRREAEALIAGGLVTIDGARVDDPGRKIEAGQTLTLAEQGARALAQQITVVLNKPVGFVSAQPEKGQLPAARLVTRENLIVPAERVPDARTSLAPLGRLDQDSRGLLLLSEDGALAKAIIGPASAMEKEYRVSVEGAVNEKKLALLRFGLSLDGRELKPAQVSVLKSGALRFVLTEGRNRQIRRMCEAVGLEVRDLLRLRIGPVRLGDLPEGRWRPLAPEERNALLQEA